MTKSITYKWGSDSLLIELGNRTESRIQVLFWAEFLFTSGMATILLMQAMPLTSLFDIFISICSSALYIVASYRFLVRMFSKEMILLNEYDIVLVRKTIFAARQRHFSWSGISPLYYIGQVQKTAHPLKGNSFDYFGFDTHEHLIQRLHHEGNLYFYYGGQPIHFARNIYSWHAEEMIGMMKLFAGDKLRLAPELQIILKSESVDNEGMGLGIEN